MALVQEETLRQGRILLVDDDVSSLCLLENVLNRLGFPCVRKVAEATRALGEVGDYQPDLVITDLEMPELDGIQLVSQLRAHLPRDSSLPILVLTGTTDARAKRNALMAGATDIIFKPFDSSEMLMRVRNLLRTRFLHLEIQNQNRLLEDKVAERTCELEQALTELKESQRQVVQQERFRAFGEMAGGVVHDFNNALMSVIGYSGLLLEDDAMLADRDLVRSYLKTMNTAGRDASHVVARLRDFYRPREEGDVFAAADINGILEEIVPLTRPKWHDQALETGRVISVELELQKIPPVLGNSAELREVITNLVFNAVDAMPNGGRIILRTKPLNDSVQIEVVDDGMGMTDEVRARCLEPFFSTKGEHGTGLGLSMSFGIIRRHEGIIEIDTAPGRGTTFRLSLPVYQRSAAPGDDMRLTLGRVMRVLVVDDDSTARDVVAQCLRSDGHRVTVAKNGGEAMQRLISDEFDLLITDQGMPGMSGVQLGEAARRVNRMLPVILLTGFSLPADQEHASVDLILKKPLARDELRGALQHILGSVASATVPLRATPPELLSASPANNHKQPDGSLAVTI